MRTEEMCAVEASRIDVVAFGVGELVWSVLALTVCAMLFCNFRLLSRNVAIRVLFLCPCFIPV